MSGKQLAPVQSIIKLSSAKHHYKHRSSCSERVLPCISSGEVSAFPWLLAPSILIPRKIGAEIVRHQCPGSTMSSGLPKAINGQDGSNFSASGILQIDRDRVCTKEAAQIVVRLYILKAKINTDPNAAPSWTDADFAKLVKYNVAVDLNQIPDPGRERAKSLYTPELKDIKAEDMLGIWNKAMEPRMIPEFTQDVVDAEKHYDGYLADMRRIRDGHEYKATDPLHGYGVMAP